MVPIVFSIFPSLTCRIFEISKTENTMNKQIEVIKILCDLYLAQKYFVMSLNIFKIKNLIEIRIDKFDSRKFYYNFFN